MSGYLRPIRSPNQRPNSLKRRCEKRCGNAARGWNGTSSPTQGPSTPNRIVGRRISVRKTATGKRDDIAPTDIAYPLSEPEIYEWVLLRECHVGKRQQRHGGDEDGLRHIGRNAAGDTASHATPYDFRQRPDGRRHGAREQDQDPHGY